MFGIGLGELMLIGVGLLISVLFGRKMLQKVFKDAFSIKQDFENAKNEASKINQE